MRLKNRNRSAPGRRGQALAESALVLVVFPMVLFAIMDFSQMLFTH
jgi:Flp pilus assembly protein TadG